MKTITILFAAIFALQVNFLFAANDGVPMNSKTELNYYTSKTLAPATPKEANFEDQIFSGEFIALAPLTPEQASFEDAIEDSINTDLVPVTPMTADFSDDPDQSENIRSLAPVIPTTADFDELN